MKRYSVGIIALLLAITCSSFTSRRALDKWFRYDGTNNSAAQVLDPANYTDVGATDPGNPANVWCVLAFIHVEVVTEVHISGTYAGKPKVDVTSSIRAHLVLYVINQPCPTEFADRIYVK